MTVITKRRTEKAANKPIVRCTCESLPVKALFDSGAECNVISKDLFDQISKRKKIYLSKTNGNIKCANGEIIHCLGVAWLTLTVGQQTTKHPFKVVDSIFPEVIAGIKLMKQAKIKVVPEKDCIMVKDTPVKFLSSVRREEDEAGNERAPTMGAVVRC